jgi:hypothetical protein
MTHSIDQSPISIEARFRFTADHLIRGMKNHARGSGILRAVSYLGWLMIFGFFVMWYKQDFMSAVPMALIGLFFLLGKTITYSSARRQFRRNPHKDAEISWYFSPDKISSAGEGFDNSLAWNKVFKFVDTAEGFLIYPQKQLFYWVPFSGFKSESDVEGVRNLVKSKVSDYQWRK